MLFFRKKLTPEKFAEQLGKLMVDIAIHDWTTLQKTWRREFDDRTEAALRAEFAAFMLAVADRLTRQIHDHPVHARIMQSAISATRARFTDQRANPYEREQHFDRLYSARARKYASCSSIIGEEPSSIVSSAASHFVETFLPDVPRSQLPAVLDATVKTLAEDAASLMHVPPFGDYPLVL